MPGQCTQWGRVQVVKGDGGEMEWVAAVGWSLWRGQQQQDGEGGGGRKERVAVGKERVAVAGRRGQWWQEGEGSSGRTERVATVAQSGQQ